MERRRPARPQENVIVRASDSGGTGRATTARQGEESEAANPRAGGLEASAQPVVSGRYRRRRRTPSHKPARLLPVAVALREPADLSADVVAMTRSARGADRDASQAAFSSTI